MTEHSPGPWSIEEVTSVSQLVYCRIKRPRRDYSTISVVKSPDGIATTGVYGHKDNGRTAGRQYTDEFGEKRHRPVISAEECRANARLIAAAPDMLAALKKLMEARERMIGDGTFKTLPEDLHEAIDFDCLQVIKQAEGWGTL